MYVYWVTLWLHLLPPLFVSSSGNIVGASPLRVCPFIGRQSSFDPLVKYPILLNEDGGRRVEDGKLRLDQGEGWRMNHLELKIQDGGPWIEDRPSKFQDFIMPHQHLIHIFLFTHSRKYRYFGDIYNFSQVCWSVCLTVEKNSVNDHVKFL